MDAEIVKLYGNKVRVRICGLCWKDERLLMVKHRAITETDFWAPPGGGLEFGQTIEESLKNEFEQETGLLVNPGSFRFGCEFIKPPLHAIELFFEVTARGGELKAGSDPELQIIESVRFMSADQIHNLPRHELHGIFRVIDNLRDLKNLRGFFAI